MGPSRLIGLDAKDQPLADASIEPPFGRFLDRERDEFCTFAMVGPDELRCLPASAEPTRYFADAACTKPVVILPACAPRPTFAVAYSVTGAPNARILESLYGGASHPLRVTDAITLNTVFAGSYGGDDCLEVFVPNLDVAQVLVTEPLDPAVFARAKLALRTSASGKLQKPEIALEQGLVMTDRFGSRAYDVPNASMCEFLVPTDHTLPTKCAIPAATMDVGYRDDTCIDVVEGIWEPAANVARVWKDGKTYQGTVAGATFAAYVKDGDACHGQYDFTPVTLGEEVTLAVGTSEAIPRGAVAWTWVSFEDLRFHDHYEDMASGTPCWETARGSDGKLRCIKDYAFSQTVFRDAACTAPVLNAPDALSETDVTFSFELACGLPPALHRRGAQLAPPQNVYRLTSLGNCYGVHAGYAYWYERGVKVDLDALPTIERP